MRCEIFAESSNQAIRVLVIFASNVKRADTRNSLPIFRVFFEDANSAKISSTRIIGVLQYVVLVLQLMCYAVHIL